MNNLKSYLPNIYDDVREFEELVIIEDNIFDELDVQVSKVRSNQYVLTSDIDGIIEYEKLLNIIPKPTIETTEFRRERIMNRLSMVPPFSFRFLKQKLDEIIGVNKYTASIDYPNYTLYIESSASNQIWFHEILITITKLKPANIVFINKPLVHEKIRAGESINLGQINYNYRLGTSWVLGQKSFTSFDNMGVIKMATAPSIKAALLNHMATFTASDIAQVRINGSYIVPSVLTKTTVNNIVTIEYPLSAADGISEVTRIELLDSLGEVLTDSAVYVPILEAVTLKHNILINEGV